MFLRRLVLSSVVLLFAFPSAGLAAVAGMGLTGPLFDADTGESNWLTLTSLASGKFEFHDLNAGVGAMLGCTGAFGGAGADCSQADAGEAFVRLEDRDDNFTSSLGGTIGARVDGGTGNDHIVGGNADDHLSGAAGNDITDGGSGDDVLDDAFKGLGSADPGAGDDTQLGGQGNDTILAGAGADTIDGGPGTDTVDYSSYTAPITVNVDAGSHDDGAAGEGDTVTGVERVLGGSGADVIAGGGELVGGAGDDTLRGGSGADTLRGDDEAGTSGSGNDTLDGGAGADVLRGGDGINTATYASRVAPVTVTLDDRADDGGPGENDNVRSDVENLIGGAGGDTLVGSATANALTGGAGDDHLSGAGGADVLDGGDGRDLLDAEDGGPDAITCGPGEDTVNADASDAVAADCEHVNRPAVAVAAPAPVVVVSGAPSKLILAGGSLTVRAHGRVRITLGCPAGSSPCAGRVGLTARGTLASASFRVPAGSIRTVTLTLTRSAAHRVHRSHRLAATLTATNAAALPVTLRS